MSKYPKLLPGDIVGVRRNHLMAKLSKSMVVPHTDLYHFFIIGEYLEWADDYVILESISKGIAVGRLSFYDRDNLVIFRRKIQLSEGQILTDEDLIRRKAAAALSLKGRARYDWMMVAQLIFTIPSLILKGKLPPYQPEDLPYGKNKAYICTEAVVFAWWYVGWPVVPDNIMPVPAAIIRAAYQEGILEVIYEARWPKK